MQKEFSVIEEVFNSITHGLGVVGVIAGISIYFFGHFQQLTFKKIVAFSIFGICLFMVYLMSTLSHSLSFTRAKNVFQILDRSAIYLLIAGTYTPFVIVAFHTFWSWLLLLIIWTVTITGITLLSIFREKNRLLSSSIYLLLGWASVLLIKPLLDTVAFNILLLLLLGGISYSVGTVFFILKKIWFGHTLWHICVLMGSICHFLAIYLFLI